VRVYAHNRAGQNGQFRTRGTIGLRGMIGIERRCTESGLGTGRYQCPQRSCERAA